ncbi:transposase [Nocardia vinacea]
MPMTVRNHSNVLFQCAFHVVRCRSTGAASSASLWTNSYFVATVGGAPVVVVRRYVEQRKTW